MSASSQEDHAFLNRLAAILEANLSNEKFGVSELASEIGLSRSMLHRKLKKLTGKSATEFITEIRLEKATELLEKSDYTSAEIAYKVGFNSPSYFNKVFRKYYKISPGDLRKGKKVVSTDPLEGTKRNKSWLKISVLVVLTVLLAVVFTWAGVHFFKGKTDYAEKSVAILPFDNLSSNENTQYFADGIVEDLLNRLSPIDGLKVISRTSSEMFRDKGDKTVPEIGEILGVSHVVEGTVQRVEDRIRISVQFINTKTDDHIFSKQYDRDLSDFFEVQSEIAGEIASELSLVLTNTELEALKQNQTKYLKAFELYQLGRYHSSKRKVEELFKGIEYYKKAIDEDSDYAQAYAGLADNYYLLTFYSPEDRKERLNKAYEMAYKALEIDPDLTEANTVLGSIYTEYDWNWDEAEKVLKKAIKHNPNFSTAHQYYAELLKILGRNEEAREHMNKALQLDPFSIIIRFLSARYHYDQEQFEEALADINICLDMDNEFFRAINLEFDINLALKKDSAIINNLRKLSNLLGMWTPEEADSVYQIGGIDGIKNWVTELNDFNPEYTKAIFYGMLGEYENALDMLELAMEANALGPTATTYLEYKPLRSNPRFIAIREKMGLPPLQP